MLIYAQVLMGASIVVGGIASAMALFGRYRTLPGFLTGPTICKLEAGGCQALFRTRNAALLGIPNSALGIAYYGMMAVGLRMQWPLWILWIGSCPALVMSIVLAWVLLRNRLECRICWTSHCCNLAIWTTLLFQLHL